MSESKVLETPFVPDPELQKVLDKPETQEWFEQQQLDRAKILEVATLPNPATHAVDTAMSFARDIVYPSATIAAASVEEVTAEEFNELKAGINDSFGEIAGILLDLQARFERLDERIEQFNRRGGHKF